MISMETIRRITANMPSDLLAEAQRVTGTGITETLVEGLKLLRHRKAYEKGMRLKGRLRLKINLERLRERSRH
jgi:hypothetical protein